MKDFKDITVDPQRILDTLEEYPLMIHDIARVIYGDSAYNQKRFSHLQALLNDLEAQGKVKSSRPSPTMSKRYERI